MGKIPLGEFEQEVMMSILRKREGGFALEVRREIEAVTGEGVSRGAFYTTLERLERKRFVEWVSVRPPESRRNTLHRRYSLTQSGLAALRATHSAMQSQWQRLGQTLEEA